MSDKSGGNVSQPLLEIRNATKIYGGGFLQHDDLIRLAVDSYNQDASRIESVHFIVSYLGKVAVQSRSATTTSLH